jgi:hypothetical protein
MLSFSEIITHECGERYRRAGASAKPGSSGYLPWGALQ